MSLVSVTKISNLMLASVAEQAGLSLTWSETPEDTFSHDEAHLFSGFQKLCCTFYDKLISSFWQENILPYHF